MGVLEPRIKRNQQVPHLSTRIEEETSPRMNRTSFKMTLCATRSQRKRFQLLITSSKRVWFNQKWKHPKMQMQRCKKKCDSLIDGDSICTKVAPNLDNQRWRRAHWLHLHSKDAKRNRGKNGAHCMIEVQQMTAADHCPETVAIYPAVYKLCSWTSVNSKCFSCHSGKVQFNMIERISDPMTLELCQIIASWRIVAWMSSQESNWRRMTRQPFFM